MWIKLDPDHGDRYLVNAYALQHACYTPRGDEESARLTLQFQGGGMALVLRGKSAERAWEALGSNACSPEEWADMQSAPFPGFHAAEPVE